MRTSFQLLVAFIAMNSSVHAQSEAAMRSASQASRSDSIDILHTAIVLDLTQVGTGEIFARTTLRWTPKVAAIDHLPLDLLVLTVDSVTDTNGSYAFAQAGETLDIDLGGSFGPADTLEITIHYHGDPVIDIGGWGGFYTAGSVLYNLGVAFTAQPHSFGRAWFPCFDNFVERSTFEYIVKTNGNRHTWCSGRLLSETDLGGGVFESHWILDETIPSYLASVTASTYAAVRDTFPSIGGGAIPVDLVAQPGDTTQLKNSFLNLQQAFDAFEEWFGPYRWDRVGYCLTPQGAMEHVANISYPTSIVNGTLQYEATMAHGLARMGFGNLITCARAEEMYINEGFAEYLSYLFLEAVYGRERYMNEVRDNHRTMVHRSHLDDEGWWALGDMPQDHTYGTITYNKGADVLHSLRSYLGDSLFRTGLTEVMNEFAFQAINTDQLRDSLGAATGVDLSDYFTDWILQPGWAAFEVDSFTVVNAFPDFDITVHLEQKLRGPSSYYHNVPLTFVAVDYLGSEFRDTVLVGGQYDQITFTLPFIPTQVRINEDERISLAITQDRDTLTSTGLNIYTHADLRLTVNTLPAPADLIVQEYWVAADDNAENAFAYVVSPDRWWRMSGTLPTGTDASGRITFDARPIATGSIDIGLVEDAGGVAFHEDSVVLLYRMEPRWPWTEVADFTVSTLGSATDGFGRVDWNGFALGDYTLGWRKSAVGVRKPVKVDRDGWIVYPNPATDRITVEWRGSTTPPTGTVQVTDSTGKEIFSKGITRENRVKIDLGDKAAGPVMIQFAGDDGTLWPVGKVSLAR